MAITTITINSSTIVKPLLLFIPFKYRQYGISGQAADRDAQGWLLIRRSLRYNLNILMLVTSLKKSRQSGFTIVELLIVIVVIAILAAISIMAYNGMQQRAKLSAVLNSAKETVKRIEMYNTDIGNYPLRMSDLISASSTAPYKLSGIVYGGTLSDASATNAVTLYVCATGNPANIAAITATNISGARVYYRDYTKSVNEFAPVGSYLGPGIACHATSG